MLFQEGDEDSEWTGVQYPRITDGVYPAITNPEDVALLKINCSNTNKESGHDTIITSCRTTSDYRGYLSFIDSTALDSESTAEQTVDMVKVYVMRQVLRSDQTEDDGDYIRMEAGKSLRGAYYQADGSEINFTTVLKGAMSGIVGATGLAVASSIALLAF